MTKPRPRPPSGAPVALSPGKLAEERLDHPMFGDAFFATFAATFSVALSTGWGAWSLLFGLLAGLPGSFVLAILTGVLQGDDPVALKGRLYGSLAFAGLLGWAGHAWAGPLAGLLVGAGAFAYLALQIVRRHRQLPPGLAPPPARDRSPAAIPGPVGRAAAELPPDLGVDLRARVDAALENYRQLHEILHDPVLLAHVAVDAPGMLAAAEEVALDLLRQIPRLARIQALADRRDGDEAARAAAAAAFAALDQHADALQAAASAAFRMVAAGPGDDAGALRDHTARLHQLHAADDLRAPPQA